MKLNDAKKLLMHLLRHDTSDMIRPIIMENATSLSLLSTVSFCLLKLNILTKNLP